MPLSKARNRDRMREIRLHTKNDTEVVQPNHIDKVDDSETPGVEYVDADGYPVYNE